MSIGIRRLEQNLDLTSTFECVEVRLSEDAGSEFGASWELRPPSSVGDVGVAQAST